MIKLCIVRSSIPLQQQHATPVTIPLQQIILSIILLLSIVLAVVLGIRYWRISDPYVRDVLSRTGDEVRGHAIFQMNCAGCHGLEARGLIGPSLWGVPSRRSRISLIDQVTSGKTPPMPKFQPKPQEMADLLSYLESL